MGGVTPEGKVYSLVRPHSLNGLHSIAFLAHLVRQVAGRILVIWDGSPIHRRAEVKAFLADQAGRRIHLEALPPYAPDLNPVEWLWKHLKKVELRNLTCLDLEQLHMNFIWPSVACVGDWLSSDPSSRGLGSNCELYFSMQRSVGRVDLGAGEFRRQSIFSRNSVENSGVRASFREVGIPVLEHLFARWTTTTARLTDDAEAMGNDLDPVLCTVGPATAHRRPHAIQLLGRLFPTDLPSPAGPTFRLSATELLPFRERVRDGIGMPGTMAAVARPGRLARIGHHRGPHRVGLDVPQKSDEQVVAVLDDRGSAAALPDVAAGSLSPVVPPGVSDGQGLEDAADQLPRGRLEKQMKMVGHQAVAEDANGYRALVRARSPRNISRSPSGPRTSARLFPRLIAW